jgi:hypothetical protein
MQHTILIKSPNSLKGNVRNNIVDVTQNNGWLIQVFHDIMPIHYTCTRQVAYINQ